MLQQSGLLGAALLLGLAGMPHCVAMCGAPSSGVIRLVRAQPAGTAALQTRAGTGAAVLFHVGRLGGYVLAGALVSGVVQALDLAGERVAALKPAMVLLHAAVLAWGVMLLATGRQPAWAHGIGHGLARRLQLQRAPARNALLAGAAWVLMPCGLLYSALALASLGNGPVQGALVMLAFGSASGAALTGAAWLFRRLRSQLESIGDLWFTRVAGAILMLLALDALWMDVGERLAAWCGA